jgi:hypothetical protein
MPDGSTLFYGLVFGAVGFIGLRHGRRRANTSCVVIGIGLIVFPYFFDTLFWNVLIGVILTSMLYLSWEKG